MQPPTLLPLAAAAAIAVLLLAVAPTPAVSRHRHSSADTETLDVAASLSRARAAVSTDSISLHQSAAEAKRSSREGGGLTLRLHSRDFLPEAQQGRRHETYRSLVLSRLRRDSRAPRRCLPARRWRRTG
ncbi:unnamed protein product [Miscanthus lutarioriparius]|uniref:Uncharacterized protein n=1 Tax=Miscanthus lutarioriparius TaxID=422564 RepID=A0A811PE77_9POAL|nr:unnamed protein product [Miscanthus lutarioriparius]